MKNFIRSLSVSSLLIIAGLITYNYSDAQCDNCQYFAKDKGCISIQLKFDKEFSGLLTLGNRTKCIAGSGECSSTSCS